MTVFSMGVFNDVSLFNKLSTLYHAMMEFGENIDGLVFFKRVHKKIDQGAMRDN